MIRNIDGAGTAASPSGSTPAGTSGRSPAGTSGSTPAGTSGTLGADGTADATATAERVWRRLRALVLEQNERRKETADALGMSFIRVKALRRIAAAPKRMSELAAELGTDRPYVTLVVDDLVKRGLVERNPHPTDRRCKIVTVTPDGRTAAARADAILGSPPDAVSGLPAEDLAALDRITSALAAED